MSIKKERHSWGNTSTSSNLYATILYPIATHITSGQSGEKAHNMGIFKGFRPRGTALLKSH